MKLDKPAIRLLSSNRRFRLIASSIIALVVFAVTKNRVQGIVSFMYVWIAFALTLLLSSWFIMLTCHPIEVRAIAREEDWGATFIFLCVVFAAFISLFAIIYLLKSIPDASKRMMSIHILLAIASVFCSWTLIHTLFTLRYAHRYYDAGFDDDDDNDGVGEGLDFPNEKEPDYLDFAYFSFVIGMTFQVSDVQITSRKIRRLSLLHAFLSFIYNTVIVALSINIISGLIAK